MEFCLWEIDDPIAYFYIPQTEFESYGLLSSMGNLIIQYTLFSHTHGIYYNYIHSMVVTIIMIGTIYNIDKIGIRYTKKEKGKKLTLSYNGIIKGATGWL